MHPQMMSPLLFLLSSCTTVEQRIMIDESTSVYSESVLREYYDLLLARNLVPFHGDMTAVRKVCEGQPYAMEKQTPDGFRLRYVPEGYPGITTQGIFLQEVFTHYDGRQTISASFEDRNLNGLAEKYFSHDADAIFPLLIHDFPLRMYASNGDPFSSSHLEFQAKYKALLEEVSQSSGVIVSCL